MIAKVATADTIGTQPARVVDTAHAYAIVGLACAAGLVVVLLLGRPPAPTLPAALGLAGMATICFALYGTTHVLRWRVPSQVRLAALVVVALATGLPGYFFGPNSGFAAVVALAVALTGLLAGIDRARLSVVGGWLVFLALLCGQALCVALVLSGRVADRSLTPLVTGGHPMWHHAASHAFIDGVYAAAFLAGRALQRRYATLIAELESTLRATSLRDALLDEARSHYRMALARGRAGLFSGQSVGGYRLGALIARGGAGEVYEAESMTDGSIAAVKVMRGDQLDDPDAAARFLQETLVSKRVESRHVVRVYAAGDLKHRLPFIAMERLEGVDLEACVKNEGPLDAAAVRQLAGDLGDALAAIHRQKLLHLDVSPRNVMRTSDGWKLIDFGAARLADGAAAGRRTVGTRAFVAPERLAGEDIDVRADVYAFAACLHYALTGKEVAGAPEPALATQVRLALAHGLAITPSQRCASAEELRDAVLGALDADALPTRLEVAAPPAAAPAPPPAPPEPTPTTPVSATSTRVVTRVWTDAHQSKMRSIYAGISAVCIGGAFFLSWLANERGPLLFAIVCIMGIAATTWLHRALTAHKPPELGVYWPWALAGALSVGPAYSIGLHSGFAAIVAGLLFCGGAFRTTQGFSWTDRRGFVFAGVAIPHAVCFVLIWTGVIRDSGNVPVLPPNLQNWQPLVIHGLIQTLYALALYVGLLVDDRYRALMRHLEAAAREAAQKEALLVTARAELDRALAAESEGLFTGQPIGRFRALRLIARGGMGEVYEAADPATGERVALKLIRRDMVANPRTQRLFANEASTVERVRSPFVARVIEVGGLDGDLPFLAMEYIDGRSLAAVIRERGRLAGAELRRLISDVATGLRDVHEAGVLHRDVKPDNVMLTQVGGTPCWKLVDFGVAKLMIGGTTENLVVGTPAYMAPEQLAGGRLEARTDLYSFCLVLYRALTGRPAFGEADRTRTRLAPPDPRRFVDLSMELEMALRIGLAEKPEDRFASATELREVFLAALDERLSDAWHERGIAILAAEPWARLSAEPAK